MATVETIKSDGSGDYTTPQAWYDAHKGDITSDANAPYIGELYGENFSATIEISGSTTDSSHYFHLRAVSGSEFSGDFGDISSVPRLSGSFGTSLNAIVEIKDDYTICEGFVVGGVSETNVSGGVVGEYRRGVYIYADNVTVRKLGVYDLSVSSDDSSNTWLYGIEIDNGSNNKILNCAIGNLDIEDSAGTDKDVSLNGIIVKDYPSILCNNSIEGLSASGGSDSYCYGIYYSGIPFIYSSSDSYLANNIVGTISAGTTAKCFESGFGSLNSRQDYVGHYSSYDASESWATNPSNMTDGDGMTYASTTTSGDTQLLTGHATFTFTMSYYDVTKVEIEVSGYVGNASDKIEIQPVFNGTTAGSWYDVGASTSDDYYTVDITNDANAPSTWTDTDLNNLDIRVKYTGTSTGYVSMVDTLITYKEQKFDNNASSDTTASFSYSSYESNITPSNEFEDTTLSTLDIHLKSTATCVDAGLDLSSLFTDDIDGDTRSGTWDIGADEYVSSSTNVTVTPSALSLTSSLKTSTNLGVSKPSALNVSGQVLSPSIVVTEPVSALSISSNLVSPSLLVDSTVSVSVLDLSLQQTSVSLSETFIASVLSLSSQINTPTLSSEISSSGESLILSLLSPTVSVSPTVSPSVLSLTGSVLSPTFETSIGVSALSETLSVSSVTLQAGCTLTATVLSLASSLLASQTALTYTDTVKALSSAIATPSYSNILLADSSQINATLLSPDRILTEIVSEETLTLALNTPTVLVSTNIIVPALTLTESLGSSQLEILIQPSALADTLSVQSSSVLIDAVVSVSALNLTTSLISSQNAVSYIDTTKSIASSVISPDLGSTLIQTKESLVASLLAPTKIDTEIISSETLTLAIKTPSLIISSNVPVSALELSATTISPSFKTVIPVTSLSESLALLSSSVSTDTSILLSALTLTSDLNSVQIVEKILSDTLSAILSVSSTEEILTFIDSGNNLTSTLNPVSLVSGEGIQVAVSAIDATLALLSSIISISSTVSVSVLNSSLTVLDPVISLPAIVETSILNVEVSVIEPTIKIDSSVIVPPVSFSGAVNSAVEESKTVLNVLNLTDSVVNPDIAISEFVLLSKLSLSLSVKTPKVSGELEQEPPRAADTSKRRRPFVRDVKYEFNVDGIKLFIFEKKYLIKGIRNNIRRFIFRTRGQKEFKFNFVLANLGKIRTEVAVDLELRGNKRVLIAKNLDVFGAKTNVLYFGYLGICGQKYANINYEYDTAGIKQTEYSCEEQLLFCGTVRKMSANIYPVVGRRDINKILEALSLDNF